MKIISIKECNSEAIKTKHNIYRRYSTGVWTCIRPSFVSNITEYNVNENKQTELEQAYQEFKQKGK